MNHSEVINSTSAKQLHPGQHFFSKKNKDYICMYCSFSGLCIYMNHSEVINSTSAKQLHPGQHFFSKKK